MAGGRGRNAKRRELPMVEVEKSYEFTGPEGEVGLADLFAGRPQLIVRPLHVRPGLGRRLPELHRRNRRDLATGSWRTSTRATPATPRSRGPRSRSSSAGRRRTGWDVPWYSSFGSDFNYDFGVTIDGRSRRSNRTTAPGRARGARADYLEGTAAREARPQLLPARRRRVFHTYSLYARGAEATRRLVLLPGPHRARPPGGVGGAPGRAEAARVRQPGFRDVTRRRWGGRI